MAGLGAAVVHRCRQVENPRQPGFCACGKRLDEPTVRQRDVEYERQLVESLAHGIVDHEPLWRHMMARTSRTTYGPQNTVRVGIDWLREGKNELPDCVNYLSWFREENPNHPDIEYVDRALQYVMLAYDAVGRVGS